MNSLYKKPAIWLMAAIAMLIAACGGGGDPQSSTPAPVGVTMTVGPIGGFGSVIVNGIRFDDSSARVEIEDGDDDGGGLKLGVVARVEGKISGDRLTGKADSIKTGAEIKGPVESVDAAAKSFVAMGATVKTNAATLFQRVAADLSDLKKDDLVQVHGTIDADGAILATRIERKNAGAIKVFKTVGKVAATPAPTTTSFKLGTLTVNYTDTANVLRDLPNPIPAGTQVRVKSTAAPVSGAITASHIRPYVERAQGQINEAEVKGLVSDKSGDDFKVAGIAVKILPGTQFLRGAAADLKDGSFVEVEGSVSNGVIQARKIKFEDRDGNENEFEFKGAITDFVSISDFKVKGQKIDASKAVIDLRAGTTALANGLNVEVKGRSMNGDVLIATRVHQED